MFKDVVIMDVVCFHKKELSNCYIFHTIFRCLWLWMLYVFIKNN